MSQQDYSHADIVGMLKAAATNPQRCPRNPSTCQCPDHARTTTTRLHVVTSGPRLTGDTFPPLTCTGLMTCPCSRCHQDRVEQAARTRRAAHARQPWEPTSRRAAA